MLDEFMAGFAGLTLPAMESAYSTLDLESLNVRIEAMLEMVEK